METIIELILTFIPPRLFGFLLAVAFIAAGLYMWTGGSRERALFDAATGRESKSYQAKIRHKTVRSENTDGYGKYDSGSVDVNYLIVQYEENGKLQSVDVPVERDEYDAVKEDDTIAISFHPNNPEYVITPMKKRPGVIWYRIGGGIFIVLGVIFILMILASFAG